MTALSGPSGAGKSTIVSCLLADMAPDVGRIALRQSASASTDDEIALSDIDPTAWRRQISWVPQSPTLVPGTVLDNMGDLPLDALTAAVSEETVVRAINAMRDAGRTVIVIAHRAAMMEAADVVIDVRSAADEEARA